MTKPKTASKYTAKKSGEAPSKPAVALLSSVRTRIKQLLNPGPPTQGESPYWVLRDALVGAGVWSEQCAPAVTLLLNSVSKASDSSVVFMLVGDIIGGDQLRGWLAPLGLTSDEAERSVHAAAEKQKRVLFDGLASSNAAVKSAVAMTIAMLPSLAPEAVPLLIAATEDRDDHVRAGALLALGRLGIGDQNAERAIASARGPNNAPVVRGAAGLAWLRQVPSRPFKQATEQLRLWLGQGGAEYESFSLPWFNASYWYRSLPFLDPPARSLSSLARSRGPAEIESLLDIGVELATPTNGAIEAQVAKIMLDLGGFASDQALRKSPGPTPTVLQISELSAKQKDIAKRLAMTHLLPAGGYGLPASGAVRRRWAGIDPPAPLDRLVPAADGRLQPLWRAWQTRLPEPGDFADPIDRWQALIEYAAASYPPFFRGPRLDQVEAELSLVVVDDVMYARALALGDDLAARFAATSRTRMIAYFYLNVSTLLLCPLIRAGRAIPESWDVLVAVGPEPQSRELLLALSPSRRERIFIAYLQRANVATILSSAQLILNLIDLAPTKAVFDAVQGVAIHFFDDPLRGPSARELAERVRAVASHHADTL